MGQTKVKKKKKPLAETTSRAVVKSFCRWTSIRGLQHVVRAENVVVRRLWAVFVVIMFIANIVLVALLVGRYYRFNTIETINTLRGVEVEFPSVTVCNVDPVNTDRIYCLKNSSNPACDLDQKYTDILDKYKLADDIRIKFRNQSIWNQLEDNSMVAIFYQMIGMEAANQISHQQDDFIIAKFCQVTTLESGGILKRLKCNEASVKVVNFVTYKYFNCYTLTIMNRSISTQTIRLSVTLYLDEEEDLNCQPHCTHEFTEWAGGKVVIHPISSYPTIEEAGMNLLPGASNQILISETRQVKKRKLSTNNCEQDSNRTLSIAFYNSSSRTFNSKKAMYTDMLCVKLKSQAATVTKCSCLDFLLPIPGELKHRVHSLEFCGNLSNPQVETKLACNQAVRQRNQLLFIKSCPAPCVKNEFNFELTQLRWPQKPRILKYYADLKDRIYYDRKFKIYEEIKNMAANNSKEALRMLQETNIFENNFLQVDINRPGYNTLVTYTENEEYTLTTILSQIGGICSIFLSFTCVTVLELFELALRMIWVGLRYRGKPKVDARSSAPGSTVSGSHTTTNITTADIAMTVVGVLPELEEGGAVAGLRPPEKGEAASDATAGTAAATTASAAMDHKEGGGCDAVQNDGLDETEALSHKSGLSTASSASSSSGFPIRWPAHTFSETAEPRTVRRRGAGRGTEILLPLRRASSSVQKSLTKRLCRPTSGSWGLGRSHESTTPSSHHHPASVLPPPIGLHDLFAFPSRRRYSGLPTARAPTVAGAGVEGAADGGGVGSRDGAGHGRRNRCSGLVGDTGDFRMDTAWLRVAKASTATLHNVNILVNRHQDDSDEDATGADTAERGGRRRQHHETSVAAAAITHDASSRATHTSSASSYLDAVSRPSSASLSFGAGEGSSRSLDPSTCLLVSAEPVEKVADVSDWEATSRPRLVTASSHKLDSLPTATCVNMPSTAATAAAVAANRVPVSNNLFRPTSNRVPQMQTGRPFGPVMRKAKSSQLNGPGGPSRRTNPPS